MTDPAFIAGTPEWIDKTNSAEGTGTAWAAGSTGALSHADEIVVGFGIGRGNFSSGTPDNVPSAGWTAVAGATAYNANIEYALQYKTKSGDTAAENPGGTWDEAYSWWLAAVVSLQPAAAPQRHKTRVSGAFATKTVKVKVGGAFVEKPVKVKTAGAFV